MATIAKGMITLNSVNDAFSVSLSPSLCIVNAKWDGGNPDFSNAYSDLSLYRGEVAVPFEVIDVATTHIKSYDIVDLPNNVKRIKILEAEAGILNGKVSVQIKCGDDFSTWVSLPFTVVRESSMLDWILDWEGREKTEIAGEYVITPKIFVGKSENGGQLTGTYIGPSFDDSGRVGVFGYAAGKEIFHLDDTGGMIGGWQIKDGGIQSADGYMNILSEGSIVSAPNGTTAWELLSDGTASFANGNVKFNSNGDADFKGTITSTNGRIGGWGIGTHSIYSKTILIDSEAQFIGLRRLNGSMFVNEPSEEDFYDRITKDGGISIFSKNDMSYGIECWIPLDNTGDTLIGGVKKGMLAFSLGSTNLIAGWLFDNEAFYTGEKQNTANQYTLNSDAITIGSNGLRGCKWRLEATGAGALAGGNIEWTEDGKVTFNENVWLSWNSKTGTGTKVTSDGVFTGSISADNIAAGTISTASVMSKGKWALNTDGSGYLASGNIAWKQDGGLSVKGDISMQTLRYIQSMRYDPDFPENEVLVTDAFITAESQERHWILPHLEVGEFRVIKILISLATRNDSSVLLEVDNPHDMIVIGTKVTGSQYQRLHLTDPQVTGLDSGLGYFELIGRGGGILGSSDTIWYVIPLYLENA